MIVTIEIDKHELVEKLLSDLLLFRNELKLKQSELAERVGISRQTLLEIEKGKRTIQWNVFVALLAILGADKGTSDLLDYYEIYTPELVEYLISPKDIKNK